MRTRRVLAAGVLGVLALGARHDDVVAAQACYSECRREITMVPCSEEVITYDDEVIRVVRRYWSNGADY